MNFVPTKIEKMVIDWHVFMGKSEKEINALIGRLKVYRMREQGLKW